MFALPLHMQTDARLYYPNANKCSLFPSTYKQMFALAFHMYIFLEALMDVDGRTIY
jgi:hypothetical protein